MTIFSLTYKLHNADDHAILQDLMAAWEGQKMMESTWILRRNDGCTCQDIIDDLLEHISTDNEIFVAEIGQKDGKSLMKKHV